MNLRTVLDKIPSKTLIRIFAGPQTIFNGKHSETPERKWNMCVRPYADAKVHHIADIHGTITIMI